MRLFVRNILIFLALLVVGDVIFYYAIGHRNIPWEINVFETMLEEGVDVIYFGDSTTMDIAPDDEDIRPLPEMVDDAMPERRVDALAHYAYHGEVYEEYARLLAQNDHLPDAAIIPINLRSFSPSWDLRPEWQFEKEKFLLRNPHIWARLGLIPLAVFRYIDLAPIRRDEFEAAPVSFGEKPAGRVGDYEVSAKGESAEDRFRKQFIYCYAYPLTEENRKLQALLRTARHLRTAGIAPIVYITPVDYASGSQWVGEEFSAQLDTNIRVVKELFREEGIEVLDLSRTLGPDAFCYDWEVHEHLDEGARRFVAGMLVEAIETAVMPDDATRN